MSDGNGTSTPADELPPKAPDELELIVRYRPADGRCTVKFPDSLDLTLAMLTRAQWAVHRQVTTRPGEQRRVIPVSGTLRRPR